MAFFGCTICLVSRFIAIDSLAVRIVITSPHFRNAELRFEAPEVVRRTDTALFTPFQYFITLIMAILVSVTQPIPRDTSLAIVAQEFLESITLGYYFWFYLEPTEVKEKEGRRKKECNFNFST